jgi:hypothetical protein
MANSDDTTNNNKWFFHPSDKEQNINRLPLHATTDKFNTTPIQMLTSLFISTTATMGHQQLQDANKALQYCQFATKQIVRCNQMTTLQYWRILHPMQSTPREQETQTSGSEEHPNHSNSHTSGIPDHV